MDETIHGKPAQHVLAEKSKRKSILDEALNVYVERQIEERIAEFRAEMSLTRAEADVDRNIRNALRPIFLRVADLVREIKRGQRYRHPRGREIFEVLAAPVVNYSDLDNLRVGIRRVVIESGSEFYGQIFDPLPVAWVTNGRRGGETTIDPLTLLFYERVADAKPTKAREKRRK